jgi:hypothetical protein
LIGSLQKEGCMNRQRLVVLLVLLTATLLLYALTWQAQVIQEQGALIRVLRQDSAELMQRKLKDMRQQRLERQMRLLNAPPAPAAGVACLPHQICG